MWIGTLRPESRILRMALPRLSEGGTRKDDRLFLKKDGDPTAPSPASPRERSDVHEVD